VIFSVDKVELRRRDGELETLTEIAVSPEDDAEVRRVTVVNHGDRPREVELTSYAEVVLAPHGADLAHPTFHKLFVQTYGLAEPRAVLCRRRPRSASEPHALAVHVLAADHNRFGEVECETDRARFLGRRRGPDRPRALDGRERLSGTVGPVLDPIFSVR